MEQERVTYIIILTTITVLIFAIAMIVLFSVFHQVKNQVLNKNQVLQTIIKNKLKTFIDE